MSEEKKGFKTKHGAQEYEREFLLQAEKDMDMTFEQFFELYSKDNQHNIRPHTWIKKEYMVKKHVMPYFGKSVISKITNLDIIEWQNELLNLRDSEGKGYCLRSSVSISWMFLLIAKIVFSIVD